MPVQLALLLYSMLSRCPPACCVTLLVCPCCPQVGGRLPRCRHLFRPQGSPAAADCSNRCRAGRRVPVAGLCGRWQRHAQAAWLGCGGWGAASCSAFLFLAALLACLSPRPHLPTLEHRALHPPSLCRAAASQAAPRHVCGHRPPPDWRRPQPAPAVSAAAHSACAGAAAALCDKVA